MVACFIVTWILSLILTLFKQINSTHPTSYQSFMGLVVQLVIWRLKGYANGLC